jgi:hypothetical protein
MIYQQQEVANTLEEQETIEGVLDDRRKQVLIFD